MKLGYNTNGFAHHRLEDTIPILAKQGYQSIALTLDVHCLPPDSPDNQIIQIKELLDKYQLDVVVETGARFLLDPEKKHFPTLLSNQPEQRSIRTNFLFDCIDMTHQLGGNVVSLWSGKGEEGAGEEECWERLVESLGKVLQYAEEKNVVVGFEPEPGMFIDTMYRFEQLIQRCDRHPNLKLTLDVGHLHCQKEFPISDHIVRWQDYLVNIHIEDMVAGIHDHLMFGEGEMDFPPIMQALKEIQFSGGVHVELSRHSHNAVEISQQSYSFLSDIVNKLS